MNFEFNSIRGSLGDLKEGRKNEKTRVEAFSAISCF